MTVYCPTHREQTSYGLPMRCPVLTYPNVLRPSYAMSGTDMSYHIGAAESAKGRSQARTKQAESGMGGYLPTRLLRGVRY
eukprot:2481692-Rhodomonas_salina.1